MRPQKRPLVKVMGSVAVETQRIVSELQALNLEHLILL